MKYDVLGDSDVRVSRIGLGCNNFGTKLDRVDSRSVCEAAFEHGITFFDTADIYGAGKSEEVVGEFARTRRGEVVIATKFGARPVGVGDEGVRGGAPEYVRQALEGSLRRLQTDYVDVIYYHIPDRTTPIIETLGILDDLVTEGVVRCIGCSNVTSRELEEAEVASQSNGSRHFAVLQDHYSLLERDAENALLPLCRKYGVAFVPYFPLANGLLTGKYRRGETPASGTRLSFFGAEALREEVFDAIEMLAAFAGECGHTLLDLALAGLVSQPGVASAIAGATSADQVRRNARAVEWELTEEELARLPRIEGLGPRERPRWPELHQGEV